MITCDVCGHINAEGVYCENCGVELRESVPSVAAVVPEKVEEGIVVDAPVFDPKAIETPPLDLPTLDTVPDVVAPTDLPNVDAIATGEDKPIAVSVPDRLPPAKLGIKKFGALSGDSIPLLGERLTLGRFDPSSGPVDIDVTGLSGAEHISRRHAELYVENGVWKVRDLGSTNGVFIKRMGESAFSPRAGEPQTLNFGDEIAFGNLILVFQEG
ncbi:MAG: FHA domain-containing protein [Deinococcaceae bacterium]